MNYELWKEIDPAGATIAKQLYDELASLGPPPENLTEFDIFRMLEKPPDPVLGDYALPCFRLAKILRKSPPEIARDLQFTLSEKTLGPWVSRLECKGAFLNFFTNKVHVASHVLPLVLDGKYFALPLAHAANGKTRVMIEFSQPNTHKEFHIGHARNVCLGDSLCRIFRYLGYKLIAANYLGDVGTHVAKCLWQVMQKGGSPPANDPNKGFWYGECYVEAVQRLAEASPEQRKVFEKTISEILADIEAKRGKPYELWVKSREECLADFHRIYQWLDVHFDYDFYESELSEESQSLVDEYIQKGLFQLSEGAYGINLEADKLGFFMARKSDGGIPYITRDLVLARRKFKDFHIDRSIYVVASEQNFHFQQLFKALDLMGFPQAKACFHLSYALVKLPDGKMSSRKGNAFPFAHLRKELLRELGPYLKKYENTWSEEERTQTTDQLAVGAIKYGMLGADPAKEIVFDLSSWTAFEGNTGPYLMYSYARTRSILEKCKDNGFIASRSHFDRLQNPFALELLRAVYDFHETVVQSCEHYKPSILANFLYNMCKSYNRFYVEVPILKAQSEEERGALIALLEAFAKTLHKGLNLLGITPPEKM